MEVPPVYAFDTPGMMLPFLGHGPAGAERGAKLALIGNVRLPCAMCRLNIELAGIKEGLYQSETLAEYLLYKLNVLNPISASGVSCL